MRKASPDYSVPALEKGLEILEALSASFEPLTLSSLANVLNRKNNEIFRMLNLLERRSYVLRDDAGGYRLSLRMFQIARAHNPLRRLIEAAEPAMRSLVRITSESCHLSILEGAEIVVLSAMECPRPVRLSIAVGARFDAIKTVSGRVLLGSLPEDRRTKILRESAAFRAMGAAEKKKILLSLDSCAGRKWGTSFNETVAGVADAAVAVGNPDSGIHAAIAISALTTRGHRHKARDFLESLEKCRLTIEQAMGAYSQTHGPLSKNLEPQ